MYILLPNGSPYLLVSSPFAYSHPKLFTNPFCYLQSNGTCNNRIDKLDE